MATMDGAQKKAAFFSHTECEYFPCHATDKPEEFNCLFCYCPLYALGERCGGRFTYTSKGIKNCMDCAFPHVRGNYAAVIGRFKEIAEVAGKQAREQPSR